MLHDLVLEGRHVRLEPLREEHAGELAAAIDPEDDVWRWTNTAPRTEDEMRRWIADRQRDLPQGRSLAFLQREPAGGRAMGSTSLFHLDEKERCAEIGHTWLAAPFRRTGANTEAKLLLLTHAFEMLRLVRVQLVTDVLNTRSRAAIQRTGAKEEGVLRNHRRRIDGTFRDSVYFSVVDREWPETKAKLAAKLRVP